EPSPDTAPLRFHGPPPPSPSGATSKPLRARPGQRSRPAPPSRGPLARSVSRSAGDGSCSTNFTHATSRRATKNSNGSNCAEEEGHAQASTLFATAASHARRPRPCRAQRGGANGALGRSAPCDLWQSAGHGGGRGRRARCSGARRGGVDDYPYLHAGAETTDGRLYSAARFIKAAGGCSAPAGKDQALALERLGKMKLTLAERLKPDAPINAKLLISHPNSSGLKMDQVTRNYIPADFMQTLEVTYNGQSVFRLESDIAISEDPSFSFSFRPSDPAPGVIKAEILDSSRRHFTQSWPVAA